MTTNMLDSHRVSTAPYSILGLISNHPRVMYAIFCPDTVDITVRIRILQSRDVSKGDVCLIVLPTRNCFLFKYPLYAVHLLILTFWTYLRFISHKPSSSNGTASRLAFAISFVPSFFVHIFNTVIHHGGR